MNKALLITAIAGVGVVAVGTGSMVVTNNQVDSVITELQNNVSAPMTLEVIEDTDSFTNRNVVLSFSVDEADQPIKVLLANNIQKRPWGTTIEHKVLLDESTLSNVDDDQAKEIIQKYFIDQPVLSGTTIVGLTGSYDTSLATASFDEQIEEFTMKFHAMTVNAKGDMSGNLKMTGQWPGMEMAIDELEAVSVKWLPMEFDLDGQYVNSSMFIGNQTVDGEGVEFTSTSEWSDTSVTLGPYTMTSKGDLQDDRFEGDFYIRAGDFALNMGEDNVALTNVVLSFALGGIEADNYQNIMQGLNDMQVSGVPSEELMNEANTLLQNGFTFGLPEWKASVNESDFLLDANFELPQNEVADVNNPFSLMGLISGIKAEANIKMDATLADIPEVSEQLSMLMMTGALVEDGDQYVMNFTMENGEPLLNGQPVPLPF